MGLFKKEEHRVPKECIYDPYYDLESEIVGEVQRILKMDDVDELPEYEKILRDNEDMRKHLLKLLEIFEACDQPEIIVMLIVARENYPGLWHRVNARIDKQQRDMLDEYKKIAKGDISK